MSEKDISEINIIYDIKKGNYINIFGSKFVKNNKNIYKTKTFLFFITPSLFLSNIIICFSKICKKINNKYLFYS